MVTVRSGQKVLFTGDSITFGSNNSPAVPWYAYTGGFADQVNAMQTTTTATLAGGAVAATLAGGAVAAVAQHMTAPITIINTGIGGNKTADLLARVQADVVARAPDVVVIEIGVNDLGAVPPATIQSNCAGILAAIRSGLGNIPVAWVSVIWAGDELWTGSPPAHNGNLTDTLAVAGNAAMKAACDADGGVTWIDMYDRVPLLESVINTADAASGIATVEGVHPKAAGMTAMGGWARPFFTVIP